MFALMLLGTSFENCLIKIAGALKLIFKCLFHTLIEKFLTLSFSNKEALLIKQSKYFNFDFENLSILSISFSLYAYVYILARTSFLYQSQNLIDLSKNLGFSKIRSFLQVILPSARPAIVAGLSLVAMETLAEFGAVDFFSINTLTTGIYNSWITFDDLAFANRISFFLLLFIFILFLTENLSRKKAKYHLDTRGGFKQKEKIKLSGTNSFFAFLFCFLLFFLSFLFPLGQMLYWTIKFPENLFDFIKIAEKDDDRGKKMYQELMMLYKTTYAPKAESDVGGGTRILVDQSKFQAGNVMDRLREI